MQVNILNLQSLFANPVRYEIPLFQRPYVWNQEQQWDPLWEDVRNTAERILGIESGGSGVSNPKPHFLGAIVLQQQPVPAPMFMTRAVVDGQQRLTTMQLMLDAIQEVLLERSQEGAAARLELLVLNNKAFCADDPDLAYKVWPTRIDQEAFRHAMHNELPSEAHKDSQIVQAHEFFKLQTNQWLDANALERTSRARALEQAVTSHLELVVIDLDLADDPHVIFETLNARGTALLQSDLIKNMVLYEAEKSGISNEDAERLWGFQDKWWREEIRQGRLYRQRIDAYLNYWIVMRKVDEVLASDVFSTFRRYYSDSGEEIVHTLEDIGTVSNAYRELEQSGRPGMAKFLYRWRVMQAGVLTPALLWLLSSDVPPEQLQKGLRAIESHQVRRMICRMSTMGANRLFITLVDRLEAEGPEVSGDTILEFLGSQESRVGEWPNDSQLEKAFVSLPLYRLLTRGRLRIVLEGIEENLRTDKVESPDAPRNLTIEHIMPRAWRNRWKYPHEGVDGLEKEEQLELERQRDHVIHSIGNLTLVTSGLQPVLSNAPWDCKQGTLNEHSVLFLNKDLLTNPPQKWDECAIEARSRKLAHIAIKAWPHADKI